MPNLYDNVMGQVDVGAANAGLTAPMPPQLLVAEIIRIVLSTVGIVFIVLIVYGGYMMVTAGGEEEKAKKAQGIIQKAVVGLVIILMAYSITLFVAIRFQQAAGASMMPGLF